jgi:hypothetical protein
VDFVSLLASFFSLLLFRIQTVCSGGEPYVVEKAKTKYVCYDMEVGENRVRVFYGTEKREEKDLKYIQEA